MRRFGEFLLRGTWQTPLIAFLFTFIPLFAWMGTVIMVLVTLRKGAREGAMVLFAVMVPEIVFVFLGHPVIGFAELIYGPVLAYGMALILRNTTSWVSLLYVSSLFGMMGVLCAHLFVPHLDQWWLNFFNHALQKTQEASSTLSSTETGPSFLELKGLVKEQLPWVAKLMTGTVISFTVLGSLLNLVVARAWQAYLYNPGGLRQEMCSVRLHKAWILLLALTIIFVWLGVNVAWDLLPLVLLPLFPAGLSLVHAMLGTRKNGTLWIVIFYVMLVLLSPYSLLVLLLAACVDSVINLRKVKGV